MPTFPKSIATPLRAVAGSETAAEERIKEDASKAEESNFIVMETFHVPFSGRLTRSSAHSFRNCIDSANAGGTTSPVGPFYSGAPTGPTPSDSANQFHFRILYGGLSAVK
jgi:hypothetical protein